MKNHRDIKNRGLTFIEILISLIIFTVAMLGFSQIFKVALDTQHRAAQEIIATNLARGLMAEIMAKNFTDPEEGETGALGPNGSETRGTFDDVDDYNGYTESPPRTLGGLPLDGSTEGRPDYSAFRRSVSVVYCSRSEPPSPFTYTCPVAVPPLTDYKRATVTVSCPYVIDTIIDELKTKPAP